MSTSQPLSRILLVDDDATTNHVNRRMLASCQIAAQIDVRADGQEALTYLRTPLADGSYPAPEVILLDLKMPVLDGYGFLEQYAQLPAEQRAQNLYILSSAAGFYDRERLKNYADVVQLLDKPLEPAYVMNLMREAYPTRFTA